jgi:hypothetical protein
MQEATAAFAGSSTTVEAWWSDAVRAAREVYTKCDADMPPELPAVSNMSPDDLAGLLGARAERVKKIEAIAATRKAEQDRLAVALDVAHHAWIANCVEHRASDLPTPRGFLPRPEYVAIGAPLYATPSTVLECNDALEMVDAPAVTHNRERENLRDRARELRVNIDQYAQDVADGKASRVTASQIVMSNGTAPTPKPASHVTTR